MSKRWSFQHISKQRNLSEIEIILPSEITASRKDGFMEETSLDKMTEEKIREIIDSLQCILTKHDSCAELIELKDNAAVIFCGDTLAIKNCCFTEILYHAFHHLLAPLQRGHLKQNCESCLRKKCR